MRKCIEFNTKEKAERVIFSDLTNGRKHHLDFTEYYNSFSEKTTYLVFYTPVK